MKTLGISFSPTQSDLEEIEKWLIDEDQKIPNSGFYCNWANSILPSWDENQMVIIYENSYPIGFMTWMVFERTGTIQIAEIRPGLRKQGYGRILTEALSEYLRAQNIIALKVHCRPATSEAAWKKLGFEIYPEVPDFLDFNHLKLGRTLYRILLDHAKPTNQKVSGSGLNFGQ